MTDLETLAGKSSYILLKAWRGMLLIFLGILTTITGCTTVGDGYAYLCYGVIPPGSVSITGPENPLIPQEKSNSR